MYEIPAKRLLEDAREVCKQPFQNAEGLGILVVTVWQASLASGFTGQVHHRMQPSFVSFKTVSFMKLLPVELSLLPQSI